VLVNAHAGGEQASSVHESLAQAFADCGMQARVVLAHGGAFERALDEVCGADADVVVAAGGDGTQSAVAGRLAGTGRIQGVLPLGTLNHFAKDLGIPLALQDAVRTIAEGEVAEVDVGEVNGRVFINNSSIGLYPLVVRERERRQAALGHGKWRALAAAALRVTRRVHHFDVHVEADATSIARRASSVFVGNNEYAMEGFGAGSRASLAGGQLVLYLSPPATRLQMMGMALRVLVHELEGSGAVEKLAGQAFEIRTHHHHIKVATDGEVCEMDLPLRYRVRPGALRVIVPPRGS
jgi:diacylglycerol kinase family enzyme